MRLSLILVLLLLMLSKRGGEGEEKRVDGTGLLRERLLKFGVGDGFVDVGDLLVREGARLLVCVVFFK